MRDTKIFEWSFLILLIIGIVFAFMLDSLFMQSLTIFIFGMVASTLKELKKLDLNFPYVLLIIGFILGYLITTKPGFRLLIVIVFILGIFAGRLFKKKLENYIETRK